MISYRRSKSLLARTDVKLKPPGKRGFKRPKDTKKIEYKYIQYLKGMTSLLKKNCENILVSNLSDYVEALKEKRPDARQDDFIDDLNKLLRRLGIAFSFVYSEDKIFKFLSAYAFTLSDFNKGELKRSLGKSLGVNPFETEPYLRSSIKIFVERNVGLIKSIQQKFHSEISEIVLRGMERGTLTADMAREIRSRYGVTESKAQFLARDQAAKFNSSLTQIRQKSIGVEKYKWSTSLDEAVRPSHRSKHDNVYAWDEPPSDTGHPGEDYRCRCVAIAVFEEPKESENQE